MSMECGTLREVHGVWHPVGGFHPLKAHWKTNTHWTITRNIQNYVSKLRKNNIIVYRPPASLPAHKYTHVLRVTTQPSGWNNRDSMIECYLIVGCSCVVNDEDVAWLVIKQHFIVSKSPRPPFTRHEAQHFPHKIRTPPSNLSLYNRQNAV